jgi:hypothetical protein
MSEQSRLFITDIYDALGDLVRAAGGPKSVGEALYPKKQPDDAAGYVKDCLNRDNLDTNRATSAPLSAAFPSMPEKEIEALTLDIEAHGQREPGVLLDGMVLDGWHRYLACDTARRRVQGEGLRRGRPGRLRHFEEPAPPAPDGQPARRGRRGDHDLAPVGGLRKIGAAAAL